jgi:preprotein translocase subunit SecA
MTSPSVDYRKTLVHRPAKVTEGLDAVLDYLVGRYHRANRHGEMLRSRADRIHERALEFHGLSESKLKSRLQDARVQFRRQGYLGDELIDETLALLCETSGRTLGMHPYPVQLMCALSLDSGYLAEMGTGEGKSLTAALAGVMAAWTGRPCHILTTNDYLAGRDAMEFRDFYRFCGVDAGAVVAEMEPENRQEMYGSGVVYTTSKELLADFLRDRLRLGALHHPQRRLLRSILEPYRNLEGAVVLRGIDTAIVDEADSVIVDEAVTPLIISAQHENKWLVEAALAANEIADDFFENKHFTVDDKYREIEFTDEGYERMAQIARLLPGIWQGSSRREEIIRQAMVARQFYKLDQHYVIQEGKVVIVDEFTGRLMPNRSWGNGLHQAVEAKEGIELTNPTETLARLSFQRFFRLFRRLSGMTGTAREASDEFWHIYRLPVMSIPTNRPVIREAWEPQFFVQEEDKWQAIRDEIIAVHNEGRPILVGTKSVKTSQRIADSLDEIGLSYRLLNAVNHVEEARLVKEAGQEKIITIATNMAGRGTDIKLAPTVAQRGGLHVIVAERNDSGRIDRQLIGRCARQGDPGSTRSFAALDDDLLARFGSKSLKALAKKTLEQNPEQGRKVAAFTFDRAQDAAQKLAYKQRKTVLRMDTWLDEALIFAGSDGIS